MKKLFGIFPVGKPEEKGEAQELLAFSIGGQPIHFSRDYQGFATEGYEQNVIVFSCIDLISVSAASVPWTLYKRKNRKERVEVDDHPVLDLLDKPNPIQSYDEFTKAVLSYLLIDGNSFIEATVTGSSKEPQELWALMPDRMTMNVGQFGLPSQYIYKVNQKEKVFQMEGTKGEGPIRHIKLFNPLDDWRGMSPMKAAALGIDQHNAAGKWNVGLLQNGTRPSGIFELESTLEESQRERIKSDLRNAYSGEGNSGKIIVLESGMKFTEAGNNAKDVDFSNGKNASATDIALTILRK